jgi:2-keto-4-pentenoate hydratase
MDIEHAADTLWAAAKRKEHMPAQWAGRLDMGQAYAIQLAIAKRRAAEGDRQVGWKVGLTSKAMRLQQNVPEPCFACLFESGQMNSGVQLEYSKLIRPGIENELCLTLGRPLSGREPSFEEARAAIATVQPALELVEVRGNFGGDLPLSIADNAQQYAFITGDAVPYDGAAGFEQTEVEVYFNDELREKAFGAEVMGSPVYSLIWLAGKLAEYGRSLEAGTKVMTGSFTKQYAVREGDHVRARFSGFGTVEARF